MKKRGAWELAWLAQAALIVLPVVVLSGVALHFLREDKVAIEQEARDRANLLAPDAARQIGEAASARLSQDLKSGRIRQGEIVDGQGLAVPDYPRVPAPADWPSKLPAQQAQLWQTAQDATYRRPDAEAARKALMALASSGVSAAARANAQLGLLAAAEGRGDAARLIHQAVALARQYPGEVTESGVPIASLALLLALRHVPGGDPPPELLAEIERNVVLRPSFLTPELLQAAGRTATVEPARARVAALRDNWPKQEADRERTRELMRTLAGQLAGRKTATPLPYQGPPRGLALCAPQGAGWRVTLVGDEFLRGAMHPTLPAYMGASIDIGGVRWRIPGGPEGAKFISLAAAPGSLFIDSKYSFTLILDLANPGLLYAPFHRRLILTEWLIFSAAGAALLGLLRLWQIYRAQARLSEMKSNLVSSVSHELRAPIAAVRLMAESLESGRVEGETKQKDYYRLIVRECRRLSSLIENVLDFARIDQGSKQYRFEPLDPVALLRHTVMLMEPGAAERQVRLSMIDPPRDFEKVQPSWDAEAVEQSLVNLLDNAIKHSPAGAEVRVETETLPEAVRFWVSDQGPGIPAGERQRIFDLFYRLGSELRRETEGVGIGLSIVKHVAEAHRGRVLLESTEGQGSRFGLELPR